MCNPGGQLPDATRVGENLGPELALIAGLSFPKIRSLCDGFREGQVLLIAAQSRDRRAGRPLY
jgi:hypothetical protein